MAKNLIGGWKTESVLGQYGTSNRHTVSFSLHALAQACLKKKNKPKTYGNVREKYPAILLLFIEYLSKV